MMGTGPFIFEKWDKKQQITFKRNPNYWGHKAHFNRIVCKFVIDPTVSLQMLKVGQLDLNDLTKTQTAQIIAEGTYKDKFELITSIANQYRYSSVGTAARNFSQPSKRGRR